MSQVASPAMPPSPTVTPFPYATRFRAPRQDGFDIVVASEIMAILCLATDLADLERRIGAIVVGFTYDRSPVSVADLGVAGAITLLLKDALLPNLVQTLGGNARSEEHTS